MPTLDLVIKERIEIQQDVIDGVDIKVSKLERRKQTLHEWQHRRTNSQKRKKTWAFCEDVRVQMNNEWELAHYVTQYLTGHG